ncbi:DUF4265 domain-containing protein [Emticicia sp. 21SJ11W-3]|uniref:DUF4265 domain-containing protein n=1 Tax=Emticicia sp. 21SJ11W-3 TaxID=2916755 RepID=UPI00209F78A8|nr:DUF4265 domain-containing protein [Emticicia sp. 21SJ11W-3]UTA66378.1 DUF4265 domain-containing protein [Emticicia sp. 21SJ11W-3]
MIESIKVKLTYTDLEGNLAIENVWADKEGNFYRIKNIPFFAYNLAYNDIVSVIYEEEEWHFDEFIEASGHSTLRVIMLESEAMKNLTLKLEAFGCSWEGSHLRYYIAIDIPADIEYSPIKEYLKKGEAEKKWSFEEACLAHSS